MEDTRQVVPQMEKEIRAINTIVRAFADWARRP